MKRFNILIIALLGVFTFASCEDFLDWKPTNSADSATAISSKKDAELFLNAINSKMLSGNYLGRNMHLYADAKGGDLTIWTAGYGYEDLYSFDHSAQSGANFGFWTQGYNILLQVNTLLLNIESLEAAGSTENFSDIKGQAHTIRAMIYFDLVRLYGEPYNEDKSAWGVPNITSILSADAQELRATVEQNYTQILSDLKVGEACLKNSTARNDGFINYWANKALQARVYLYMENFKDAYEAAEDVIENGPYSLYKNSEWVDSWSSKKGSESIYQLTVLATEFELTTGSLGGVYSRNADYKSSVPGNFVASDYFLARLGEDPDDVRWGVMTNDHIDATRMSCCYKFLGGVNKQGDGGGDPAACNIKVIRLSEVYLIAAEAALRKSPQDKAKAADRLNEIRKRAPNLEPATAETVSLDMILDERSKELYGEGHRFFDMIRNNKTIEFNDDWQGIPQNRRDKKIDRTSYLTILPLSQSEINANPGIEKQQNPGY